MIIKYNDKLNTSIKYEPLIFHFWIIDNSLTLKVESQDDRLRGVDSIAMIKFKNEDKWQSIDISSASCCEIAYHDFYILGDKMYDNDVYSFNFKDIKELLNYVHTIVTIFDNINIFDTTIYVHEINTATNTIDTKIYGKTVSANAKKSCKFN